MGSPSWYENYRPPHCDQRVLHKPGICQYCDQHPEAQAAREAWGINFTGESDPQKAQCPSEKSRPVEKIHAWPGNRPSPESPPDPHNGAGGAGGPLPELIDVSQLEALIAKLKAEAEKSAEENPLPEDALKNQRVDDGSAVGRIADSFLNNLTITDAQNFADPSAQSKPIKVTLSGKPADPDHIHKGAPQPIDPETGMHKDYWVLSAEERSKGFVRPVRRSYRHVGSKPKYPTRPLTDEEKERYSKFGYVLFEIYPEDRLPVTGNFWTQKRLDARGCQAVTTMGIALAETYARDPEFYGSTYCATCHTHFPVGENGEFVWEGTDIRVGT